MFETLASLLSVSYIRIKDHFLTLLTRRSLLYISHPTKTRRLSILRGGDPTKYQKLSKDIGLFRFRCTVLVSQFAELSKILLKKFQAGQNCYEILEEKLSQPKFIQRQMRIFSTDQCCPATDTNWLTGFKTVPGEEKHKREEYCNLKPHLHLRFALLRSVLSGKTRATFSAIEKHNQN